MNFVTADQLFFEADKKIKEEKIVEARDMLLQAVQLDPNFGRAYNHLGWIYDTKYKDYGKAEEAYKKALEVSPEYVPIYLNYAILLNNLMKDKELVEVLEKGLKVPGVDVRGIHREYGMMQERQGKYGEARESYTKALQNSWVDSDIKYYEESIQRCNNKEKILK